MSLYSSSSSAKNYSDVSTGVNSTPVLLPFHRTSDRPPDRLAGRFSQINILQWLIWLHTATLIVLACSSLYRRSVLIRIWKSQLHTQYLQHEVFDARHGLVKALFGRVFELAVEPLTKGFNFIVVRPDRALIVVLLGNRRDYLLQIVFQCRVTVHQQSAVQLVRHQLIRVLVRDTSEQCL